MNIISAIRQEMWLSVHFCYYLHFIVLWWLCKKYWWIVIWSICYSPWSESRWGKDESYWGRTSRRWKESLCSQSLWSRPTRKTLLSSWRSLSKVCQNLHVDLNWKNECCKTIDCKSLHINSPVKIWKKWVNPKQIATETISLAFDLE